MCVLDRIIIEQLLVPEEKNQYKIRLQLALLFMRKICNYELSWLRYQWSKLNCGGHCLIELNISKKDTLMALGGVDCSKYELIIILQTPYS